MDRHKPATGRPRLQPAAAPELEGIDTLGLARWTAAAASAGLSRSSAAQIAGVSRRTLQRTLRQHGADPVVARDLQLADAVRWEASGGRILEEAASRAVHWLRRCEAEGADLRETGAALAATIQAGHRLSEAGSRRAKRLAPAKQPQPQRFDLQGFLSNLADACGQVRALPPEQQEAGWEALRERLRSDQQAQAQPIDARVIDIEMP